MYWYLACSAFDRYVFLLHRKQQMKSKCILSSYHENLWYTINILVVVVVCLFVCFFFFFTILLVVSIFLIIWYCSKIILINYNTHLQRGECWDLINQFKSATFLGLSKIRTLISIVLCRGVFFFFFFFFWSLVSSVKMRGDCSF